VGPDGPPVAAAGRMTSATMAPARGYLAWIAVLAVALLRDDRRRPNEPGEAGTNATTEA